MEGSGGRGRGRRGKKESRGRGSLPGAETPPPHSPCTRGRDQGLAKQGESQWTCGPKVEQRDFREA